MPRVVASPLLALVLAALAAGCGSPSPAGDGPTVPPVAVARAALDAALDDWRNDQPTMRDGSPKLGLVDGDRIAGRRLLGHEVLGQVDLGVGRGFTVRLSLAAEEGGDEPVELFARYVVFGIDPIWVFRLEDYERIAHWEHQMAPEADELAPQAERGDTAPAPPD